jgi:hypothetical protein
MSDGFEESGPSSTGDEEQQSEVPAGTQLPPPPSAGPSTPLPPPPGDPTGVLPTTKKSNRSLVLVLVAVAVGVVALLGVAAVAVLFLFSGEPANKIGGTFTLIDSGFSSGKVCSGDGGYSDIDFGSNVTVYDGSGKILATGILGIGIGTSYSRCVFPVEISEKVPTKDFYAIEVTRRGKVTYSKSQLEEQDWEVSLTLGD